MDFIVTPPFFQIQALPIIICLTQSKACVPVLSTSFSSLCKRSLTVCLPPHIIETHIRQSKITGFLLVINDRIINKIWVLLIATKKTISITQHSLDDKWPHLNNTQKTLNKKLNILVHISRGTSGMARSSVLCIEHFFFLFLSYLRFFSISFFILVPLFQCYNCLSLCCQEGDYKKLHLVSHSKLIIKKSREAPFLSLFPHITSQGMV